MKTTCTLYRRWITSLAPFLPPTLFIHWISVSPLITSLFTLLQTKLSQSKGYTVSPLVLSLAPYWLQVKYTRVHCIAVYSQVIPNVYQLLCNAADHQSNHLLNQLIIKFHYVAADQTVCHFLSIFTECYISPGFVSLPTYTILYMNLPITLHFFFASEWGFLLYLAWYPLLVTL